MSHHIKGAREDWNSKPYIQLTLEQHRFELQGSIYMQFFLRKYIGKFFGDLQLKKLLHKLHSLEIFLKIKKNLGMS